MIDINKYSYHTSIDLIIDKKNNKKHEEKTKTPL